ncbi:MULTISPECIES: cupin domain-containing protein [unclassified Sphingomonas]|uniref:cupin domain-containing protein n=1 Tax=unclassified Sphingomonas TaxID=196159 RepID=UPI000AFC474F|nr:MULTISPECIES: cupin domain-containing protein [unclassified Sphingomonas]
MKKVSESRLRGAPPPATNPAGDALRVGVKLKHARLLRCLSMREVADAAGCSEGFISKIENGKAQPSLAMLAKLVSVVGADLADVFAPPEEAYSDQVKVVRANATANFIADEKTSARGITMVRLSASDQGALLQSTIHIIPPGSKTESDFTHEGEEVGYILEGEVEFTVDGKTYDLVVGDAIYYPSHLGHGYENKGDVTARILWSNTPPGWRKQLRPLS